jgi:4-aminobutyrate aminotransferase
VSDQPADLAAEGDVNCSGRRAAWQATQLGRETRALLDADAAVYLHQSLSTPCLNALVGARGSVIEDVEGRSYLDFHGNNVHHLGQGHPRVVAAVRAQLDTLPFCPRRYTHAGAVEFARRLGALAPGDLKKVLFCPGGTSAIGIALKLARLATGRHKTLSLWNAFHGASLDAITVGGEAMFRDGLGPLLPGACHAAPCDPPNCPHGCGGVCDLRCVAALEEILAREGDIGAVLLEPIRCTDVQVPPREYFQRLRAACDRHGALLIFDEIPIALGRTGRFFAFEHFDVTPDIVVLGKALGGGVVPMAGVIARAGLDRFSEHALGHYTHEKSPLGCAAGLATLDVIAEENLVERAGRLGELALGRLRELQLKHPLIGEVRGRGLLIGVELMPNRTTREPARLAAEAAMYHALTRGLSFKIGQGNVLVLTPPLTISEADLDRAITILDHAIGCAAAEVPPSP